MCDIGNLGPWKFRILGIWDIGNLEIKDFVICVALVIWNLGNLGPWEFGILVIWDLENWGPWDYQVIQDPGYLEPWKFRTLEFGSL